jgi:hypothetical protein
VGTEEGEGGKSQFEEKVEEVGIGAMFGHKEFFLGGDRR